MSKRTVRMNKKGNADNQEDLQRTMENSVNFTKLAADLAETGKRFYSRGWVWGTSGNFSAVTSWDQLHLAISSTGFDKGILTPAHFLGPKRHIEIFEFVMEVLVRTAQHMVLERAD